jgi:hypothetical protein
MPVSEDFMPKVYELTPGGVCDAAIEALIGKTKPTNDSSDQPLLEADL